MYIIDLCHKQFSIQICEHVWNGPTSNGSHEGPMHIMFYLLNSAKWNTVTITAQSQFFICHISKLMRRPDEQKQTILQIMDFAV